MTQIQQVAHGFLEEYELIFNKGAEPFFTQPSDFIEKIKTSIEKVTRITPQMSTSGGTSDARFINSYCPVVELGLLNKTAHKIDECVSRPELTLLKQIYSTILEDFFAD